MRQPLHPPARSQVATGLRPPALPLPHAARGAGQSAGDARCACGGGCPRCGGAGLPAVLQRSFETSLGTDLSAVRVHTGPDAAAASSAQRARAFTVGADLVFGAGQYRPHDRAGRRLLAHEVAHAVQQSRPGGPAAGRRHEQAADGAAQAMLAGRRAAPQPAAAPGVQRASGVEATEAQRETYVPFRADGSWDGMAILMELSQLESTNTPIPAHLPGADSDANLQSDAARCGINSALGSAVVAGPEHVMLLCRRLAERIAFQREHPAPAGTPQADPAWLGLAEASVRRIWREVYLGTVGDAHAGAGGTLTFEDLDLLAHWLYVFTYRHDDPARQAGREGRGVFRREGAAEGRHLRTVREVAEAASLAGYERGHDFFELPTVEKLNDIVARLPEGGSLMVAVSTTPHAPGASLNHIVLFFRQGDQAHSYDPWGSGNVADEGQAGYLTPLAGSYDAPGGVKPFGLLHGPVTQPFDLMTERLTR